MAKRIRGNLSPEMIRGALRHGDSSIVQMSDGTGTTGNQAVFDSDGSLTDGGAPSSAPDATGSVKGIVKLANDLGGTAALPTVVATHLTSALPVAQGGTGQTSLTAHDVLLGNGTSGITQISPGTSGYVLTSNGTGSDPSFQASSGSSPLTTKGDVYTHSTVDARLGVGSNGQVLSADSGQTTGLKWVSLAESDITSLVSDLALKAPLASPTFTGTPAAPTPSTADSTTKIATTAYVQAQAYAPLASPALTGTPTAPTAATADSSTKLATTAYVQAQGYAPLAAPTAAGITVDGAGTAPATGSRGILQVPYTCTITGWTILADQSGSCVFTVKKSTYAGFPSTTSIVASAKPTLSSAQNATSSTLTGWTTTITAGDILEFNLDSVSTCTRITLELKVTKT